MLHRTRFVFGGISALAVSALPALAGSFYIRQNLVSDLPGVAAVQDSNLG